MLVCGLFKNKLYLINIQSKITTTITNKRAAEMAAVPSGKKMSKCTYL